MQLIAKGKWVKEEKRWNMVVALRPGEAKPGSGERKPPKRAAVVSLLSRLNRQPA